jgi:hypothetical protein
MKIFGTLAVALTIAGLSVGSCLADISSVTGTGTAATTLSSTTTNFDGLGTYPTSIIGDTISSLSSQIAFTYAPPPNYTSGERLILQVINETGSTLDNISFTLSGASGPVYYDECTSCSKFPAIPSAGGYNSTANTYTTALDLTGDLNSGRTVLTVPLSLANTQEQDFYFAVTYTGTPGDFTLSQDATSTGSETETSAPEPSLYAVLVVGMIGLAFFGARRRLKI